MQGKAIFIALLVFQAFFSKFLSAEEIRDYYAEPGLNPFKDSINENFNEYIDPFSGTLQLKYTDLVVPGNGGMDIVINRVYTSLQTNQYPTLSINGLGWVMHFGRVLTSKANQDKICTQNNYSVHTLDNPSLELPDGGRELLLLNGIQGGNDLITRSNWKAECIGGQQGFIVTSPQGTRYTMNHFDVFQDEPSWFATRIEDVNGNWIRIDYQTNGAGVSYINEIYRSDVGESTPIVTYEYNNPDLASITVSSIVANGQRWEYGYEPISGFLGDIYHQLVEVKRPDGQVWNYDYFPRIEDPDLEDGVYEDGLASFSLQQVTYPYGATIEYAYQYVQFDPGAVDRTTSIHTKVADSGGIDSGTWTYTFNPSSIPFTGPRGVTLHKDETVIDAPDARYVYEHYGKSYVQSFWGYSFIKPSYVGILDNKRTYSLTGQLLERVRYSWGERAVSEENLWHGAGYRVWWKDNKTYAILLLGEYHSRDSFTTNEEVFARAVEYAEHDEFGNPGLIIEHNNIDGEPDKHTRITYRNDTTKWILGLAEQEQIKLIGEADSADEDVGIISREYDTNGNLTSETQFGLTTTYTYTYTPDGDLESTTDALGNTITYQDYKRGIPRMELHPEGVVIERTVNDTGTVSSITNARGLTTSFLYDALNRLSVIDFPINADVHIAYSYPGSSYTKTLTRGDYQQIETFNGFGFKKSLQRSGSGSSVTVNFENDVLGQKIFESYPNSTAGILYEYDALGRLEKITRPDASFVQYDYDDARITRTDERGNSETTTYRYFGPSENSKSVIAIMSPENIGTAIKRNAFNQPLIIAQGELLPGNNISGYTRQFEYDDKFYLVSKVEPESGVTTFTNDLMGNVRREVTNGVSETVFEYDNLYRLKKIDYGDSTPDVDYTYYPDGEVETVRKGSTQWSYQLDSNGNLLSETLSIESLLSRSYTLSYQYNALDQVERFTYPGGLELDYAPDGLGRATQAGTFASGILYHPNGQLDSFTLGNGRTISVTLTDRLFTDQLQVPGIVDLDYGYDLAGNITSIVNGIESSESIYMNQPTSYDGMNRLRLANGPWGNGEFNYDYFGNISRKTLGDSSFDYSYNSAARLGVMDSGAGVPNRKYHTFDYDNRGNVTEKAEFLLNSDNTILNSTVKSYHFDSADHLRQASINNISKRYDYDGNGQRFLVRKSGGANGYDITFAVHSQAGQLLFEESISTCTKIDYIRLGATLLAESSDEQIDPALDTDSDGISDCLEFQIGLDATNPLDAAQDLDGDGVTNLQEVAEGTAISEADTDQDGLEDAYEINEIGSDPNTFDSDNDGLGDGLEVSLSFDPNSGIEGSLDTDGDALSNALEANLGTNLLVADSDGDQLSDGFENKFFLNPLEAGEAMLDPDGDGLTNTEEQDLGTSLNADTDGDGLADNIEVQYGWNPLVPGEHMEDDDGDGMTNLDEILVGTNVLVVDTDGDTLMDGFEFDYGFDPFVAGEAELDEDGDVLTNFEEQSHGTNPLTSDSDMDLLTDIDELNKYLTDPTIADTDGDGVPDGIEVLQDGTDPLDPTDFIPAPEAITLPYQLTDGGNRRWTISPFGSVKWYSGYDHYRIQINENGNTGSSAGFIEDDGREVITSASDMLGLNLTRKIYVSENDNFGRFLEIIHNPTEFDVSINVAIYSYLDTGTGTRIISEDSVTYGNLTFGNEQNYLVTDDNSAGGKNPLAHVFSDTSAGVRVEPSEISLYRGTLRYAFDLHIPSGETQIIMHFSSTDRYRSSALAEAESFAVLDDEKLNGMTLQERQRVVNFEAYDYRDSDGDGIRDFAESELGTDPNNADSDGDGLADGFEVEYVFNPLVPGEQHLDPDADGVTNLDEQLHGMNPHSRDTDGDGFTDDIELQYQMDPLTPNEPEEDTDNDRLTLRQEINVGTMLGNSDTDGDSLLDGYEVFYGFDPLVAGETDEDPDGDGLTNIIEQNLGTDPRHLDSDGDGIDDNVEVNTYGTNPSLRDTDGGGVADNLEIFRDGSDPLVAGDDHIFQNQMGNGPFITVNNDGKQVDIDLRGRLRMDVDNEYRLWSDAEGGPLYVHSEHQGTILETGRDNAGSHWALRGYRKIYVSKTGKFVRILDIYENTSSGKLNFHSPGITGIHGAVKTSSGDKEYSDHDDFLVFEPEQADGHFEIVAFSDSQPGLLDTSGLVDDNNILTTEMFELSLSPGETRILMYLYSYEENLAQAFNTGQVLKGLNEDLLIGVSPLERKRIANFEAYHLLDSDSDGIADYREKLYGMDSFSTDTDGDGKSDGFEQLYGFDPTFAEDPNLDSDADQLTDLEEIDAGTNLLSADSDSDSLSDYEEINTYLTNPMEADTDGDGVVDGSEIHVDMTNPLDGSDNAVSETS